MAPVDDNLTANNSLQSTKEEEEEEEDLFVFNDTKEGPRVPAVKPGRVTQDWRERGLLPCRRW